MSRSLLFATLLITLGGCVYIPPVTQGNYLKSSQVQSLKVGMTQDQVRYLFGQPMLADPFHSDAWHYVYYAKPGAKTKAKIYRLTVYFKNGKVTRFTTSAPPADAPS